MAASRRVSAQRVSRSRRESHHSTDSLTPADELTSWLGDDVCANCGAAARANMLYCSQQCKEEDAQQGTQGRKSRASTSAPAVTQYNYPLKDVSTASSWRYPCPPSPSINAKYDSSLTSPALIALERSLPKEPVEKGTTTTSSDREESSMSSSEDGSSAAADLQDKKRRSSSQSTFSTASDILSTDRSTPSSTSINYRDGKEQDDLEDDDFEPSDLVLPPSIHPAASILLNSASREARNSIVTSSTTITPEGSKRSPTTLAVPTSNAQGASKKEASRKTLDFARRPSSTNLPAPVLFTSPTSPFPISEKSKQRDVNQRRKSSNHGSGTRMDLNKMDISAAIERLSPSILSALKVTSPSSTQGGKIMMVPRLAKGSIDSPPGIPSVSSSAGKTLRGISPAHSVSPGHGICQEVICGRFGCHGLSSSVESMTEVKGNEPTSPRRPSLQRAHKHTHSAAAGLNYLGHYTEAGHEHGNTQSASLASRSKLMMTPVEASKATFHNSQSVHSDNLSNEETIVKSPPRGRSKARGGRRSSSRRSPSPPRGAARRGHSEDFTTLTRKQGHAPSLDSHQSQALAISHSPEVKSTAEKEERRGRSPTERGNFRKKALSRQEICGSNASHLTSPNGARHPSEIATSMHNGDMDSYDGEDELDGSRRAQLAKRAATAVLHGNNGYDDVDLDEL